jgi:hypothetical protein
MSGYACKWCDFTPEDEGEELTNQQKFAELTAHQRSDHPDEMRARMGGAKARNAAKKVAQSEDNPRSESKPDREFADGDVRVRLSNEQITLPGEMFVLYHWVRTQFPEYEVTKAEWLQQVVATWAIDHGPEINLPSIPGVFINNALDIEEEEDEYDEEGDDATEELYTLAGGYPIGSEGGFPTI